MERSAPGSLCRPRGIPGALAGDQPLIGPDRRAILLSLAATAAGFPARAAPPALKLAGKLQQGGFVIGRTTPGAEVHVNGALETLASHRGLFVVGFDRDCGPQVALRMIDGRLESSRILTIAPGIFDIQRIDGLPADQVNPEGEPLLVRIAAEGKRKAEGFASRIDSDDFADGFEVPLKDYRLSARFGGQRILNGDPKRPHYGDDLAAPVGTPIHAPAAGLVAFAETGLHYEGGLTLIDHGQGLITAYLHQSRLEVSRGDRVARGQLIGAVGQEGRATGPHCCWRMKWHGRNLDPMLMVGASAPV